MDSSLTTATPHPRLQGEYLLENVATSRATRLDRMQNRFTTRGRHKLFVGDDQRRLVPARPLTVSAAWVDRNLPVLREQARLGLIRVKTLDGRPLDLETCLPIFVAPPADVTPRWPLDSIARDKPTGLPMPQFPLGITVEEVAERHQRAAEKRAAALLELQEAEELDALTAAMPVTDAAPAALPPTEDVRADDALASLLGGGGAPPIAGGMESLPAGPVMSGDAGVPEGPSLDTLLGGPPADPVTAPVVESHGKHRRGSKRR